MMLKCMYLFGEFISDPFNLYLHLFLCDTELKEERKGGNDGMAIDFSLPLLNIFIIIFEGLQLVVS